MDRALDAVFLSQENTEVIRVRSFIPDRRGSSPVADEVHYLLPLRKFTSGFGKECSNDGVDP